MSTARSPAQRDETADSTERALAALVELLASMEALELRRFGDLGLTLTQLRVLHLLRDRAASCGHVAEHLGITASTATALIERLVRRGLIERRAHPGDRRVIELTLSESGRGLIQEVAQRKGGEVRAAVEELEPMDRERLAEMLHHLGGRVQAAEARIAEAASEQGSESVPRGAAANARAGVGG